MRALDSFGHFCTEQCITLFLNETNSAHNYYTQTELSLRAPRAFVLYAVARCARYLRTHMASTWQQALMPTQTGALAAGRGPFIEGLVQRADLNGRQVELHHFIAQNTAADARVGVTVIQTGELLRIRRRNLFVPLTSAVIMQTAYGVTPEDVTTMNIRLNDEAVEERLTSTPNLLGRYMWWTAQLTQQQLQDIRSIIFMDYHRPDPVEDYAGIPGRRCQHANCWRCTNLVGGHRFNFVGPWAVTAYSGVVPQY